MFTLALFESPSLFLRVMNVVNTLIYVLLIFFRKTSENIDALRFNALFEFNRNSSAENDVNCALQIRTWKWRKKCTISSFESGI